MTVSTPSKPKSIKLSLIESSPFLVVFTKPVNIDAIRGAEVILCTTAPLGSPSTMLNWIETRNSHGTSFPCCWWSFLPPSLPLGFLLPQFIAYVFGIQCLRLTNSLQGYQLPVFNKAWYIDDLSLYCWIISICPLCRQVLKMCCCVVEESKFVVRIVKMPKIVMNI